MITEASSTGIMVLLKESTRKLHDATEDGAFNQDLIKGKLPLDSYVALLTQLYLIHRALESHLHRLRAARTPFERVLRDYQFQEPYLIEDLAFFGRDVAKAEPLPATRAFIAEVDRLAEDNPVALLGVHYVFEGSNNGGKFIARALRRVYNLSGSNGTRYLDPYGENQPAYWQAFKNDMDAVGFSPEECETLIAAACHTFRAVGALHRDLQNTVAAACSTASRPASAGKCPFHNPQ